MEGLYDYRGARNPKSVYEAVNKASMESQLVDPNSYPLTVKQNELDEELLNMGVTMVNYRYDECPAGPENWVRTNSAWPACEKRLGFRWRTPEGWCYPEGLCKMDIREDDYESKTLQTQRKSELLQTINRLTNAVKGQQREEWFAKKLEEIKKAAGKKELKSYSSAEQDEIAALPEYIALSDKQRDWLERMTKASMPADLKDVVNQVYIKMQQDQKKELKTMADQYTNKRSDDAELKYLKRVSRDVEDWGPNDAEDEDEYYKTFLSNAKFCADASVGKNYATSRDLCKDNKSVDFEGRTGLKRDQQCDFFDEGDEGDAVCIPKELGKRKKVWERGEQDPIADWWRQFFDKREQSKTADAYKLRKAIGRRRRMTGGESEDEE